METRSAPSVPDRLVAINADRNRRILLTGATVISMDPEVGNLPQADILIEGDEIAEVRPGLAETVAESSAFVVDAGDTIVIPGLVDTHRHCWQGALRRIIPNADIAQYLTMRDRFAVHYEPEDHYVGNLLCAVGALNNGITCLLDLSHNTRTARHADEAIRGLFDAGIRAVHANAPPEAGTWDRQWPDDLQRLKTTFFASDDQLVTLRLGQRCAHPDDALTTDRVELARELGIGMSLDPTAFPASSERILALADEGLLGPDMTFIHCAELTEEAWRAIAETGVTVSLCPLVDEYLAIGDTTEPTIQTALRHGIRPGISADIETTVGADLFSHMRLLLALQHRAESRASDDARVGWLTARDLLEFATVRGAETNGLGEVCGSLTPGKKADVVLIRSNTLNTMPLNNAFGVVVSAADSADVHTVLVSGQFRKWAGDLVGVDLEGLFRKARQSRDGLMERARHQLDLFSD